MEIIRTYKTKIYKYCKGSIIKDKNTELELINSFRFPDEWRPISFFVEKHGEENINFNAMIYLLTLMKTFIEKLAPLTINNEYITEILKEYEVKNVSILEDDIIEITILYKFDFKDKSISHNL